MIQKLLGVLVHHANREYRSREWYAVKNRILRRWGVPDGYDVQYFEGKKCYTCGGTGVYKGFYERDYYDDCRNCYGGWYKLPTWVILERVRLGAYVFHQPLKAVHSAKVVDVPVTGRIDGYVEHTRSGWGAEAAFVLYQVYDCRGYWQRWRKTVGRGWRCAWWLPRNWVYNAAHILRNGRNSYPVQRWLRIRKGKKQPQASRPAAIVNDELPF